MRLNFAKDIILCIIHYTKLQTHLPAPVPWHHAQLNVPTGPRDFKCPSTLIITGTNLQLGEHAHNIAKKLTRNGPAVPDVIVHVHEAASIHHNWREQEKGSSEIDYVKSSHYREKG